MAELSASVLIEKSDPGFEQFDTRDVSLIATRKQIRQAARMDDPVDSSTWMVHSFQSWLSFAGGGLLMLFNLWLIIDAIRRREWIWVLILLALPGIGTLWYFFHVYRGSGSGMSGFELPGAQSRRRIKELQAQIHHLDKPHHHSQLGDVYFSQGKHQLAEASYRAALERDPQDIDTRAHLGQCLLRQKRPAEARPLLEGVMHENPKHDYGHTMMALAETLTALGETDNAVLYWQHIVANHSYPRAKVQLAELYLAKGKTAEARAELNDVLQDDPHTPAFQRKRDRVWVRRAKALMAKLPG